MLHTTTQWLRSHKLVAGIVILALIAGGWWWYTTSTNTSGVTRYTLGTVASSTIIATISASGQVSANNQLDLKPKVSGDVIYVGVVAGQKVGAGTLIAQLDDTSAQKSVRDAQANLESAQITLKKLLQAADTLSTTQAENSVVNAQTSLDTAYTDANGDITSAFLDLPAILSGIQDIDIGTATNRSNQWNIDYYVNILNSYTPKGLIYRNDAYASYSSAQSIYDKNSTTYKSAVLTLNDTATTEKLLQAAYDTTKAIFEAGKQANALVQLYQDTLRGQYQTPSTLSDTQLSTLATYTTKLNTHLSTLLSDINTITSAKQNLVVSKQTLDKLKNGADPLDVQSSQLSVTRAQNALADAQSSLADYYIRAPFAGTIATLGVKRYDSAGSGTTVATIVTTDQIATLSVNEVDAAKIAVGQKATLTFDAIDGLTIAGKVASIDTIGSVSQGVVSYTIKINFTTQDVRVKPGMTVNASIITATAVDALSVPSSAVKTQNGASYVQVFQPELAESSQPVTSTQTPVQVPVTTGISDDANIEILSGLRAGQQVIIKTTTGTTVTTSATNSSNQRAPGFGGVRL